VSVPLQAVTVRREQQMTADGEEDMTVEAKTTVKEKKSSSIVFVRQNDKALMRKVKTGLSDRGYIEIIEGVKEGEEIVSGDFRMVNTELQDSSKIKVEPTAATPKQ
jgi:HlyD family secretion protein